MEDGKRAYLASRFWNCRKGVVKVIPPLIFRLEIKRGQEGKDNL
jgi:hypothetical protein